MNIQANNNKEIQNEFDACLLKKRSLLKEKINTLKQEIKSESVRLFNNVMNQQLELLFQLDESEHELNEKLKRLSQEKNVNELNTIKFNYDFKANNALIKIGELALTSPVISSHLNEIQPTTVIISFII